MISSQKLEKAFLVGIITKNQRKWDALESLEELKSLTKTAGALEVGSNMAEVRQIVPATFIGRGKMEELALIAKERGATLVIFDTELSASQNRNLEEGLCVRVIDRTSLILDIFALHATSREGKLQVGLAQYEYLYPRLVGAWTHLSKQRGGGVGLRGPGETQLEVDRRRVRERIDRLRSSLKKIESSRAIHRKKRESVPIPTVTLVGYTNAGKSTLFNALTNSAELAEDKLFATLDPKTKRIQLPSGREVLLTDTVGFIRKLPHQLVEAFKSTFEEARQSDLLIHVVDASHPNFQHQISVVEGVLENLELNTLPLIRVMNKIDAVSVSHETNGALLSSPVLHKDESLRGDLEEVILSFDASESPRDSRAQRVSRPKPIEGATLPSKNGVRLSARNGLGVADLLMEIDQTLAETFPSMRLLLPHPYGNLLSTLYAHGRILSSHDREEGVFVEVALPPKWQKMYEPYEVQNELSL